MMLYNVFGLRLSQLQNLAKWLLIILPMAIAVGSAVALFLWSLDRATVARFDHPWLIYAMPFAGFAMVWAYQRFGKGADAGNNLIVDQIHEPNGGVPLRMAPFILVTTVLTHVVGGSAGREGTAVQLGGSLASGFGRLFGLSPADIRILLMAGIAAGFGAVFGTPIAGALFALEVLTIGRMQYEALLPAFVAAVVADWTCQAWGITHTHYSISYLAGRGESGVFHLDAILMAKVVLAGIVFGSAAHLFAEGSHAAAGLFKRLVPYAPLRPVAASALILGLVYLLGTREYLGLGVWSPNPDDATILGFFRPDHIDYVSWFWKALFTIITLSAGFKGGEVTPLFFIGAALGSALAGLLGAPPDLFAALGFVAVFAGATNTPLACMVMAIELFGATHSVYFAVACFVAYLCSGHSSIYLSQRIGVPKSGAASDIPPDISVRNMRDITYAPLGGRGRVRILPLSKNETFNERSAIVTQHKLLSKEIGMVRIYVKPREKAAGKGGWFGSKPLYRELVLQAKAAGILNAVAHHTHFGYSRGGKLQDDGFEIPNPDLTMCVELIAPRDELEQFCRTHGSILKHKMIVYKHLEHWDVVGHEIATDDALQSKPL